MPSKCEREREDENACIHMQASHRHTCALTRAHTHKHTHKQRGSATKHTFEINLMCMLYWCMWEKRHDSSYFNWWPSDRSYDNDVVGGISVARLLHEATVLHDYMNHVREKKKIKVKLYALSLYTIVVVVMEKINSHEL